MNKQVTTNTTITLTNEDVREAIANAIRAKYQGIKINTSDISIIGNNDTVEAKLEISIAENESDAV